MYDKVGDKVINLKNNTLLYFPIYTRQFIAKKFNYNIQTCFYNPYR